MIIYSKPFIEQKSKQNLNRRIYLAPYISEQKHFWYENQKLEQKFFYWHYTIVRIDLYSRWIQSFLLRLT